MPGNSHSLERIVTTVLDTHDRARQGQTGAATGWLAQLNVEYANTDGRTHLRAKTHSGPLTIQKSLYPEGPAVCHTLILHPPSGVVENDRLDINVKLNTGSHALITMPGASKWYRSQGCTAEQCVRIHVAAGAVLEWLPPETIIFNHARAALHTRVDVQAGASYIGWEIVCLGRTASGETFKAGALRQTTEVALAGELLWNERCHVHGGSPLLASRVGLARAPVTAVMLAAGKSAAPHLMAQCRGVKADAESLTGTTAMPNIFIARYAGHSSEQARNYFIALWRLLRPLFAGREAVTPRIWNT
jgi:urease accessory protein